MLNKAILIGNLGRDPEVRATPSGATVANFTLATSRHWKDKDGHKQEQTEWHTIVCWNRLAETVGQYLSKGRQVYVEGRIETQSWEDKATGEKKYRTQIIAHEVKFLGRRSDGDDQGHHDPDSYSTGGNDLVDDDIPF